MTEENFVLTPNEMLAATLIKNGFEDDLDIADNLWDDLQAFCMRQSRANYPDAEYAAVVFDGGGGEVIGINKKGIKK